MTRYALLLRGINVGKANRVPMAELRALLTDAGYEGVATLLASGNVVLDAAAPAGELARAVQRLLRDRFGFPIDVVVRTREQIRDVLALDPLGAVATDKSRYQVVFLAGPAATQVEEALAAVEVGDERWAADGAEVYVWCPDGLRDSAVMTALGRLKGGPAATVRNWNTVEKLGKLLG